MLPVRLAAILPAIGNKRFLHHRRQRYASSRGKDMVQVTGSATGIIVGLTAPGIEAA
jgi:hypothetical protein